MVQKTVTSKVKNLLDAGANPAADLLKGPYSLISKARRQAHCLRQYLPVQYTPGWCSDGLLQTIKD
jgi:hypothetical protein